MASGSRLFFFHRVKLSWHCISLQINGFSLATAAAATADTLATENKKSGDGARGGAFENVCGRIGATQVARESTTKWTKGRAAKKKWERIVSIYFRFGRKSKTWNSMFFNLLNLPSHEFTLSCSRSFSLSSPAFCRLRSFYDHSRKFGFVPDQSNWHYVNAKSFGILFMFTRCLCVTQLPLSSLDALPFRRFI